MVKGLYSILFLLGFTVSSGLSKESSFKTDPGFAKFLGTLHQSKSSKRDIATGSNILVNNVESFKTPIHYYQYKAYSQLGRGNLKRREYDEWLKELEAQGCKPVTSYFLDCRAVEKSAELKDKI